MACDLIRSAHCGDMNGLALLIHRSIHDGAGGAYTADALNAWSPAPMAAGALGQRLGGQTVLVAEDASGLAGVFTLTAEGVLDLAYVRADRKGDGLAGRLHDEILSRAMAAGLTVLTVEASHLMRRFLEKRGWSLIETQTVRRNDVAIENHKMSLSL